MSYLNNLVVLYVEDDDLIRESMVDLLEDECRELIVANNGEEGFNFFKERNPDLVISDINMPVMNGIEMVEKIRVENQVIPIIFTTAHNETGFLQQSIELNITNYVIKPVKIDDLLTKLEAAAKIVSLEVVAKKAQDELNENMVMMQNLLNANQNILIVTNCKEISFVNNRFLDFFNVSSIDAFNKSYSSIMDIFFTESEYYLSANSLKEGETFVELLFRTEGVDRLVATMDPVTFKVHAFSVQSSILSSDGDVDSYILTFIDVSEMKEKQLKTEYQAFYDDLTKVYNRRKIDDILAKQKILSYNKASTFSIILIDIDHFKRFNDDHGHLIGDEVLVLLSDTINMSVRSIDYFARWGGEEFVVVLPGSNIEIAVQVASKLREKVKDICHVSAGCITASFGVTEFIPNETLDTLFKRADDALYMCKDNGRDRVEFLTENLIPEN